MAGEVIGHTEAHDSSMQWEVFDTGGDLVPKDDGYYFLILCDKDGDEIFVVDYWSNDDVEFVNNMDLDILFFCKIIEPKETK